MNRENTFGDISNRLSVSIACIRTRASSSRSTLRRAYSALSDNSSNCPSAFTASQRALERELQSCRRSNASTWPGSQHHCLAQMGSCNILPGEHDDVTWRNAGIISDEAESNVSRVEATATRTRGSASGRALAIMGTTSEDHWLSCRKLCNVLSSDNRSILWCKSAISADITSGDASPSCPKLFTTASRKRTPFGPADSRRILSNVLVTWEDVWPLSPRYFTASLRTEESLSLLSMLRRIPVSSVPCIWLKPQRAAERIQGSSSWSASDNGRRTSVDL